MDIILEFFRIQPGLTVQGEEFSYLPPSVMSVMNSAKRVSESGYTRGTALYHDKVSINYVISGSGVLELVVARNARKKLPMIRWYVYFLGVRVP